MQLTIEQVLALAPDAASAAAGKKQAHPASWKELGHNNAAIWGLCQGSALYRVKIDRSNLGTSCSCPSRKFPCKHALGLLLLAATSPEIVPEDEPADWVSVWLEKRQARQQKSAESKPADDKVVDEKGRQKRIDQRDARVREGLTRLDLWMTDLMRNGLAGLETKPRDFWDEQSRRLVDAQAPGLASRVQIMADLVRSGKDWPARLLDELGRTTLLTRAYTQLVTLPEALQEDIRQLVGWTISATELEQKGSIVEDNWVIIGQWVDEGDRVRTQRNWLIGLNSGRPALVLQFAPGTQPFPESFVAGTAQQARLRFYPGACLLRARVEDRLTPPTAFEGKLPGVKSMAEFLEALSVSLSKQPLLGQTAVVLHSISLTVHEGGWYVVDSASQALPLVGKDYWKLLAMTGGETFDLCAEWNGFALRPLGIVQQGTYRAMHHTPPSEQSSVKS